MSEITYTVEKIMHRKLDPDMLISIPDSDPIVYIEEHQKEVEKTKEDKVLEDYLKELEQKNKAKRKEDILNRSTDLVKKNYTMCSFLEEGNLRCTDQGFINALQEANSVIKDLHTLISGENTTE